MTDPHLDDEQLSLLADGLDVDGRAHAEDGSCATCAARLASLRAARDAVASAAVASLAPDVLDRVVAAALEAADDVAEVLPLASGRARRRRLTTPPPAWLFAAAAGVAALVGVAGVLQAVDRTGSSAGNLAVVADDESATVEADTSAAGGRALPTAGAVSSGAGGGSDAVDPELVVGDLADQDDPVTLARALEGYSAAVDGDAFSGTSNFGARQAAPTAGAPAEAAATDKAAASPSPPASTIPADRARCRAAADAIGAGRFGALLSTVTVRWKGTPAEVLVFRLAEPSTPEAPETRQALVLSRPGCELLADPRF